MYPNQWIFATHSDSAANERKPNLGSASASHPSRANRSIAAAIARIGRWRPYATLTSSVRPRDPSAASA
jgi:hypothetical protein